jgi:hypothetical protein
MTQVMKPDVPLYPVGVGLLRTVGEMFDACRASNLIQQFHGSIPPGGIFAEKGALDGHSG